jgi:hypothetical protein
MRKLSHGLKIMGSLGILLVAGSTVALAHQGSSVEDNHNSVVTTSTSDDTSESATEHATGDDSGRRQGKAATKQAVQTKLADVKLKVCQKREASINRKMQNMAARGQRQIEVFNTIAERTQAFYAKNGKTLANYNALVADVAAKKAAAQAAVADNKAKSVSFKCDGSDPKGAAQSFKASLTAEQAALKAYKTAVKNLIVGVKSVVKTEASKPEGAEQ